MLLSNGTPGTINTLPEAWGGSCLAGGVEGRGHEGEFNTAFQDHTEALGGWDETNLTHGDTHSTLESAGDRLD